MSLYQSELISELADQQVRFSPQAVRKTQIERAETYLVELNRSRASYIYGDVCYAITGYHTEANTSVPIPVEDLQRDLRRFIEDLSESLNLSEGDFTQRLYTVLEISQKLNVSAKTIDRWRDRGLASRKVKFSGRSRVVVLEETLNRFIELHKDQVERGTSFKQLSTEEREQMISDARSLAAAGLTLTDVSRKLGRKLRRATETVRYTLRDYDRKYPENAIFQARGIAISTEHQALMYDLRQQGVSVKDLARRFSRSIESVKSILSEVQIRRLKELPIEFMDNVEFRMEDADSIICGVAPGYDDGKKSARVPSGLPSYLSELYRVPLLNKPQEQYYFRKMNYLKWRASQLQERLSASDSPARVAKQMEGCLQEAATVKNLLTRSNLRLVVSIAKRHLKPGANFFELVSDGNMSLIRAIEKFDYFRGNKFSTYASWAIMKNYARSVPAEYTKLDRFRTGYDELFGSVHEGRGTAFSDELVNKAQRDAITEILRELNGRERKVIACRFGLSQGTEPETLEQVGSRMGVTKERIRQIEVRALERMRRIAERKQVDIPGI